MVNKITTPPTTSELIGKVNELVDDKQDVLTSENAGNCIEIVIGGSSGLLPAEYQEVEYLQSSGTQYIDIGVVLDKTMTIRTKYDFIRVGFVFGSRASNTYQYSGITNENKGGYNIRYGNKIIYSQSTIPTGTVDVVISPNGVVLNGEVVSTTSYGNSFYAGNCYLFTINNNGTPSTGEYTINRIRRFTIDNVIDLVPCKRKSDNVLGMYDLVNDEFLTNSGTGTFIAGANVGTTKISFVNDAGYITSSALTGYATQAWVGQQGYITGITGSDVTTALGYTPYNSSNPNGYITSSALTPYALSADLASVAISGSYNDLSDKPTIPSEVTESTVSGWGFTKNTGTVTSVNNVSPVNGNVTLSIPAAQVNSDWNATSGVARILNKPTIPTVNNASLIIQKNGTNVATFTANASSNVTANISVPTNTNELTNGAGFITSSALTGYEQTSNKVTSISSSSTDTQYPSAKCVYDIVGDIETALQVINSGGG